MPFVSMPASGSASLSVWTVTLRQQQNPFLFFGDLTNVIFDSVVWRPNRGEHDSYALRSIGTLDAQPEHCKNGSWDNAEVTEIISEARSNNDWERDVQLSTDCTVEHHRNCNAKSTDDHDWNCIVPVKADGDDWGGGLPSTQFDSISSPVSHPRPESPCLMFLRDRVHISVGPYFWRCQCGLCPQINHPFWGSLIEVTYLAWAVPMPSEKCILPWQSPCSVCIWKV